MGREQIAYAIDEEEERSFRVGKVDVWFHAVHPCLSRREEAARVNSVIHVVGIGVGGNEQYDNESEDRE